MYHWDCNFPKNSTNILRQNKMQIQRQIFTLFPNTRNIKSRKNLFCVRKLIVWTKFILKFFSIRFLIMWYRERMVLFFFKFDKRWTNPVTGFAFVNSNYWKQGCISLSLSSRCFPNGRTLLFTISFWYFPRAVHLQTRTKQTKLQFLTAKDHDQNCRIQLALCPRALFSPPLLHWIANNSCSSN